MNSISEDRFLPTFQQVYDLLTSKGPAHITSSIGTEYMIESRILSKGVRKGKKVIVAKPKSGAIYIHEDCWGETKTCQGTRAGIYNGTLSIIDWYFSNLKV